MIDFEVRQLLDLYQNLMYAYDTNNINFIWKRGLIVILTNNVSIKIPIFPMNVFKIIYSHILFSYFNIYGALDPKPEFGAYLFTVRDFSRENDFTQ